jgi:hypothetical protein
MLAFSTIYWITSVVLIFRHIDIINNSIRVSYGRDTDDLCLVLQVEVSTGGVAPAALLEMFDCIFLVNVSTVQYRAPRALASFTSIPVN